ncbi:MAG: hypothetical protein IJC78_02090 [Clostridia bacterium]|nr:hypothetical protein [Clostridia bacterium]
MNWKVAYERHNLCKEKEFKTIHEIESDGMPIISATVPGELQLDLMREGVLPDLYYSENTLLAQQTENLHAWYFTTFDAEDNQALKFYGIDTVADIYVNGELVKSVSNMFLEYEIDAPLKEKGNELIVHIKPICIEARKDRIPAISRTQPYNYPTLYGRKAAHSFGWDIMPRIVTSGIWRPVELVTKKADAILDAYAYSCFKTGCTEVSVFVSTELSGDLAQEYQVHVKGVCGDSVFEGTETLFQQEFHVDFTLDECKLWWPKHKGAQNLYDITVELIKEDVLLDAKSFRFGIRSIELDRTDAAGDDGEFVFKINGVKTFMNGTNWVPLSPFHSQDAERLEKALELLDESGSNIVRCWGGNVYASEEFYDFCDEHGIVVWQDFAMGCATYPFDEKFAHIMAEEAEHIIKRLRNHPSLILWAGDNECDSHIIGWGFTHQNPDQNSITREVLPKAVLLHDWNRPFLPSSPYITSHVYENDLPLSEDHLWGPRDYFKGEFYSTAKCHFASETGYHGCNSPASLYKFLEKPWPLFETNGSPTKEHMVHASAMEPIEGKPYTYRIKLMFNQVLTLFDTVPDNLEDFCRMSQISQAEAKKYFIERFRIHKWRTTGIIWWNLLDGAPQTSDAVVDFYYDKKLAFHYIKRSQEPVCMMFDEPNGQDLSLYVSNDFLEDKVVSYRVENITEGTVITEGEVTAPANQTAKADTITFRGKNLFLITYTVDGKEYKNHYYTELLNISYENYMRDLKKAGLDHFSF